MKKIVFFLGLLASPVWAGQAGNPPSEVGSLHSFASFWSQFKNAVVREDKQSVAQMVNYPFSSGPLNPTDFIKLYSQFFPANSRSCFAKTQPIQDEELYNVFCAGTVYRFTKIKGMFKLIEISALD